MKGRSEAGRQVWLKEPFHEGWSRAGAGEQSSPSPFLSLCALLFPVISAAPRPALREARIKASVSAAASRRARLVPRGRPAQPLGRSLPLALHEQQPRLPLGEAAPSAFSGISDVSSFSML